MKLRHRHGPFYGNLDYLEPRLLLSAAIPEASTALPWQGSEKGPHAHRKHLHGIEPLPSDAAPPSGGADVALAVPQVIVPLTASTASLIAAGASAIQLTGTAASGGTPTGGYIYQWYRSTIAGFTPSASNALPGATGLSLTDTTGLQPDVPVFYVLGASDGTTTVYSNQVIAGLAAPTVPLALPYQGNNLFVAYIGSSTWAINQGSGQVPSLIDASLRTTFAPPGMSMYNGAVGATGAAAFLPGLPFNNAVKAAVQSASGYKVLRLMIGSNDASAKQPVSTWLANMRAIINDALTWPVDLIVVEEIGIRLDGGNDTVNLIDQYNAARASLLGPRVVLGTADTFTNEADHLSTLSGDNVHQTDAGQVLLAAEQTAEISSLVHNIRPTPLSWSTDSTGTIITASLSEAAQTTAGTTGFTLDGTYAQVVAWTVTGTTLILHLSGPVARWQTVTVSGAAGTLQDNSSNATPAFSLAPVTNNSVFGEFHPIGV